jgi:hypothetical protein
MKPKKRLAKYKLEDKHGRKRSWSGVRENGESAKVALQTEGINRTHPQMRMTDEKPSIQIPIYDDLQWRRSEECYSIIQNCSNPTLFLTS